MKTATADNTSQVNQHKIGGKLTKYSKAKYLSKPTARPTSDILSRETEQCLNESNSGATSDSINSNDMVCNNPRQDEIAGHSKKLSITSSAKTTTLNTTTTFVTISYNETSPLPSEPEQTFCLDPPGTTTTIAANKYKETCSTMLANNFSIITEEASSSSSATQPLIVTSKRSCDEIVRVTVSDGSSCDARQTDNIPCGNNNNNNTIYAQENSANNSDNEVDSVRTVGQNNLLNDATAAADYDRIVHSSQWAHGSETSKAKASSSPASFECNANSSSICSADVCQCQTKQQQQQPQSKLSNDANQEEPTRSKSASGGSFKSKVNQLDRFNCATISGSGKGGNFIHNNKSATTNATTDTNYSNGKSNCLAGDSCATEAVPIDSSLKPKNEMLSQSVANEKCFSYDSIRTNDLEQQQHQQQQYGGGGGGSSRQSPPSSASINRSQMVGPKNDASSTAASTTVTKVCVHYANSTSQRHHQKESMESKRERKAAKTLAIITGKFFDGNPHYLLIT